jgi:hypothetical protein
MGKLVAYSGFSASNYLEQPYNSDLDFGTGDFCVMGWVKLSATRGDIFIRSDGDLTVRVEYNSPSLYMRITDNGSYDDFAGATASVTIGSWMHFAFVRSSGVISSFINGDVKTSTANTRDLTRVDSTLKIGGGYANPQLGSLALLRISATAPTASQIEKIYEDEKVLFQDNAQATLFGASDAVTALAFDDTTQMLHVGTSAGRSVFQGLRRVSNTTTAVGTAISASNNLIAEE